MKCNWFWGSHGCDRDAGHAEIHMCGSLDEPCSTHDGKQVRYFLSDGEWSEKVFESTGFCLGDGGAHGACGDPDYCEYRENLRHAWS